LLEEALQATKGIGDKWERTRALAYLAPHLSLELQKEAFHSSVLSMSWQMRGVLLMLLQQFFSVLAQLDGPSGLVEVERAVRDTARWFP
jgi:hypothetical protein